MKAQKRTEMFKQLTLETVKMIWWTPVLRKHYVCVTVHWVCRDINHAFFFSLNVLNQPDSVGATLKHKQAIEKFCPPPLLGFLTIKFVSLFKIWLSMMISLNWISSSHLTTNLVLHYHFNYLPSLSFTEKASPSMLHFHSDISYLIQNYCEAQK